MSEQISILAVEDEEHIRNILKYNLELDGFEVYVAENGREGLELACQKTPDVILLDWMLPEMTGLEVLSELKKDEQTKDIPVFMLTAKAMAGDMDQALREGANDYITKPFDSAKLGQIIKSKIEDMVKT